MFRIAPRTAGLVFVLCSPIGPLMAQVPPTDERPAAAEDVVVAVIDFTNSALGNTAAFAAAETGAAALLLGELHGQAGIQLVERERLSAVLDELDLVRSGRVAASDAARAGRLLGAHYVVTGVIFVDPGGTLRIDARTIEVETAAIVASESVVGRADDLVDAMTRLGGRLDLGPVLRARQAAAELPDASDEVDRRRRADLSYARALVDEDRGDRQSALAMYRAFLEAGPEGHAPELRARARARIAALSAGLLSSGG